MKAKSEEEGAKPKATKEKRNAVNYNMLGIPKYNSKKPKKRDVIVFPPFFRSSLIIK